MASCPFCVEFASVERSEFRQLVPFTELETRVVASDSQFELLAGIGAPRPGYLLLLPKRHALNFAQLNAAELQRAEIRRLETYEYLKHNFGQIYMFEHGAVSGRDAAGGCIDHAHLHFLPIEKSIDTRPLAEEPIARISSLCDLPGVVGSSSYLLVGGSLELDVYLPQSRPPSQYMRRMVWEAQGTPHTWDWAAFPGVEHLRETVRTARSQNGGVWSSNV